MSGMAAGLLKDVGETVGGAIALTLNAMGLYIADCILWPRAKKFMIIYVYVAPTLVRRVRNPTVRMSLRICAAASGPFIPCPSNFTTVEPARLVYSLILPLVSRGMKLEGGDDENLGLLIMGIFKTSSFIFTVVLLRYSHSIWAFLLSSFLRQLVMSSLLTTGTIWFLWRKVLSDDQKAKLIHYIWKALRCFAQFVVKSNDALRRLIMMSTTFLNEFETLIIKRLQANLGNGKLDEYQYSSLEIPRTIRLIKLRRRKLFTSVQCDIIEVVLDEAPLFEALSYTWRNEKPSVRISVSDGSFVLVTQAVDEFLRYRRTFFGEMIFWIDGACINQASNKDKNQQVPLMRDIYTRASRVVVWLGPLVEAEDAHLAREQLFYLVGSQRMLNVPLEDHFRQLMTTDGSDGWKSLLKVFEHPWFSRVWVVQEVALASRVDVMYGTITIGWEDFAACIEILSDPLLAGPAQLDNGSNSKGGVRTLKKKIENLSNARIIANLRNTVQSGQTPALASVLMDCTAFKSTNARDKVYGLLGITSDGSHRDLLPDYDYSEMDVFMKTAKYILSRSSPPPVPHMFQRAGTGFGRSVDTEELPSWIPDWKGSLPSHFLDSKNVYRSRGLSGWKATIRYPDNPKLIEVCGAKVDRIKQISEPMELEDLDMSAGHMMVTILCNKVVSLINSCERIAYENVKALEDAIYRVILGTDTSDQDFSQSSITELLKCMEIQRQAGEKLKSMPAGKEMDELGERLVQLAIILTPYACRIGECCPAKSMTITENGHLGFVPPLTREGDLVCFFEGLPRPFILREKESIVEESVMQYELVGGCYIDGLMDCSPVTQEQMWFLLA